MRKSIKSFIAIFIVLFGVWQMSGIVFAKTDIPSATDDFYVNDFAEVFSVDEKSRLVDNAATLADEHDGIQVVVSTIKSLDGDTVENYALEMYNQYGIGKDDMGLLILLATEDRKIRVEVGKSMEAYINDSKAGRFIDKYAIPSLKEDKFNDGLINLQEALISEVVACVDAEQIQPAEERTSSATNASNANVSSVIFSILGIFGVVVLIILIVYAIRKSIEKNNEMKTTIANLSTQLRNSKETITEERELSNSKVASLEQKYQREKDTLERSLYQKYEQEKKSLNKQIHTLSLENEKINSSYKNLERDFAVLKDRYERVNKLHPNADDEVTAMIENEIREHDMKKAQEVDSLILEVINLSANKDITSRLQTVLSSYSSLEEKQKSYVKSDIQKLNQLYNESLEMKREYERKMEEERIRKQIEQDKRLANAALNSINSIISSISVGKACNLTDLKVARGIYEDLNSSSRKYFDNSVLNRVDRLTREAKADYDREEEIRKNKKIAAVAMASISGIIAYISYGKARDLRKLKEAKNIYENLNSESRKYVDKSVVDKLDRLIIEAKQDKEEEEEEERRRKRREEEERRIRMQSSSHSSYRSSSHYGGFGGRSGGGGASRGF